MMRRSFAAIAAVGTMLAGCGLGLGLKQATLTSDSGEAKYLEDNYGKVTRSSVYFEIESDFQDVMRLYKEDVIGDTTLTEAQKETEMAKTRDFTFEPDRYIAYFFRLHQPALVHQKDFKLTLQDPQGNNLIDKVLYSANKVTVTGNGEQMVSYNYVWMMKLAKPFTTANYPAGTYHLKIASPDGKEAVYTIEQ